MGCQEFLIPGTILPLHMGIKGHSGGGNMQRVLR